MKSARTRPGRRRAEFLSAICLLARASAISVMRAELRSNAAPSGTNPCTVTVMLSGPWVVSPPTRASLNSPASAAKPLANWPTHCASASGNVKASVAQAGVAPMAARSDRLTASDFQPTSKARVLCGKCTPATSVSVLTARMSPAGTASSAASSPMPRRTSSRATAQRSRMTAIRSNSCTLKSAGPRNGPSSNARRAHALVHGSRPGRSSADRHARAALSSTPLT